MGNSRRDEERLDELRMADYVTLALTQILPLPPPRSSSSSRFCLTRNLRVACLGADETARVSRGDAAREEHGDAAPKAH